MRSGPLRHKVTLQSKGFTQSGTGAATRAWTDVVTGWSAQITPQSGREFFEAVKNQSEVQTRIILRYGSEIAAIDNTWRVKWAGVSPIVYYNIEAVTNKDERNEMIVLACTEGPKDDD